MPRTGDVKISGTRLRNLWLASLGSDKGEFAKRMGFGPSRFSELTRDGVHLIQRKKFNTAAKGLGYADPEAFLKVIGATDEEISWWEAAKNEAKAPELMMAQKINALPAEKVERVAEHLDDAAAKSFADGLIKREMKDAVREEKPELRVTETIAHPAAPPEAGDEEPSVSKKPGEVKHKEEEKPEEKRDAS